MCVCLFVGVCVCVFVCVCVCVCVCVEREAREAFVSVSHLGLSGLQCTEAILILPKPSLLSLEAHALVLTPVKPPHFSVLYES